MRVLFALLSAGFAGTERHAVELANAMAEHHPTALLLRARPWPGRAPPAQAALRAAVSPRVRVFAAARAWPDPAARWAMRRFRPSVVHAHHERSARTMGRCAGRVPVVATVHLHWRPRDFGRCAGLACLTDEQAREVPASFAGPVAVIPNWVRPHAPPDAARRAALCRALAIPDGAFVVGSVGRLEPVKNMALLLQAFAQASLPHAVLLIVGEGAQRAALEALARDLDIAARVRLAGFRADVRDLYALMDVFVSAADDEPFGLAILEAAEARVPVIATDTTGARAIAARHALRVVPTGDADALAAALRTPLPAPAPLSGFTLAHAVEQVQSLYRRVLA